MANETDSVFAADQQNGKGELYRLMMSILKEGETDNQETAQQQPTSEVEKANDDTATQQPAAEPQSVQRPTGQKQERPEQAEQPKGEVGQPTQTVQPVQDVQADELDDDTKDLLTVMNHNIDDARKYVEKLGKEAQTIMASGMSESAKREAQERYESAAKTLNERVEAHNAEQKAENERLRAEAERKQAQEKKEHEEKYADINYVSDWMDGHKVNDENNTMLTSEGFKEGAAAASGKDMFGTAKAAKEYISENTGKLSTAAISDYVNGMFAANRLKKKYGGIYAHGYIIEPIDSLVLENNDISDSVKKEFINVRTPKKSGIDNYQAILGNAVDDFVRLFEKEYKREQGKVGKKAMEDYDNIVKNPFVNADDKDAARMVFASKVLTGVDLKPMIDRAFNSIPKDRMAALTLALSKDFGYDTDKAAEYIANEFQRVCLARTGAEVESDTEAAIVGGLMNTLVGSIAQASMRSTGGGNELTLLDAYSASIDERAKEWAKQGMAGYGKIAFRSAVTMSGDYPVVFKPLGKLVELGTKGVLTTLLPRFSKGVSSVTGEAAFKMMSMTNSGRVVIGVANGAGLGAIYSPVAYTLGSRARGVTPDVGEALKSSGSGAVDFSLLGITPSIMNYGADKVLRLFNGTGKAATTIRVATNIAFKDIFGPGANAAIVTAKDALLSSDKISEDIKSYFFEKYGEFLGMHVSGKLSNIRHIADEYKVRTQLNESVFTKEELRSLGYKSVKEMFDDIYAPRWKGDPGYHMEEGKAIAGKLYAITVNPKVLESAKMKLLTAIGGGAIATPTITRSEIVSEYGEKGKEVYTVRTYTADGKVFCERDFGSLKDAKIEETRLGTVIKRNNVAIAEGAKDAEWMDTCSERATRTVLSELNGTATENELADMLKTAFEKDRNGEQLTDGEQRMLKRFDEVYLQNLRSENADNSSSARRDFNKSRGVDIDKILAKDYYKWSESERDAVDEYIRELNGEGIAKDMLSEPTEPTAPIEPPAEPANESPVVEAEKVEPQEEAATEKDTEKPDADTPSKEEVGIEDYIKINKADEETANDIRDDVENYTDEVNALRAESEQAVKYSNGESSEKPEHWDYWKEKFGLEEPKAKTEEEARPVEEPKSESEPIEPADEKPTEQPMEPKVEEKPVEAEAPKEEAKADTKAEVEQAAETEPVEEVDKHKEGQLDIINKSNPMRDEQHTGIRSVEDIKTFEEAVSDSEAPFTPDYTKEDAESALKAGEITVYSSKPIEDGVFVTPSKIEAKNYAGDGKVFSKRVSIEDVAWIDAIEGQYARLRASDIETGAKERLEREGVTYKKGDELVAEHEGSPLTIVVDAVGKSGNVTKSHVKSSGEPYHSNGKVVFTPKEKPQEPAVNERYQRGVDGVKPSKAELVLRDAVIDRLRESGMEVITNEEEGQRVLDEANGRAREMSFGEPYDYEAYPLGRVESNLADKEVMVVTAEADHGFMNYKEAKEWAKKNVSKVYNNEETGGKGDVRISNAAIDKFMSQSAVDKSDSKDVHLSVLKVLPEVLRTSIDVETHPDFLKGKDGKRSAENGMNKDVLVHRCYGAVEIGGKPYRVKITLKEDPRDVSFPHVTHSYEATKIELLAGTWENHEGPSPNTNNSISAAKLLENVEMSYNPSKKVLDASEKRSVGIREQRVWHSSGANFKDAKITDHIRFFRTANGEAYGFTVGGKIYIDPRIATSATPVHEYAHLWASALRSGNPKEWQNVVGLMKGTSIWEEVKKRYSELNTDDEIADEVIATYSGRRGAERLREEAHKVAESNGDVFEKAKAISALGRVKKSLKKFWKGVCDFLHIHYKSAEEVADRVMKDLLDGVEPMKIGKGEAGVRFSAKQKRALETVSVSRNVGEKHPQTAISSADGAKILKNLDTLADNYENSSSTNEKTFIGEVANSLGINTPDKSSKYATFETKNGKVVTVRLSNHNAKVSNFDANDEVDGISIVVSAKKSSGITNDGNAHVIEYYYDAIKLRRADGKPLAEIVKSIKQLLYSGEFNDPTGLAEVQEVNGEDVVRYQLSVAGRKANGGDTGYDSKHSEIEQAVNRELEKNSTSDEIKAEIDRVKKLRAEATKEYLSGKPHSEVAKGDAAALRERLNELNAKKTVAVENERSAKLTDKLADLNSKLIEATESGDTEKVKSLTTEIKRVKTDIGNTGIRSRYKAKISEIKSKSENVSDLAKSLVKYISGELSPILAKEMGKAEFNTLVRSVRDIAKQWNAKDGTEQDRNNLATKLDDTIRKVDDVIVGIETRKLINDLADMLSVKTTKKDSSGKKIGVKVSNTVRIAIETLKGMFRGFDGEFGNGLKSLVKSLDGMLARKKELQGRLKELELSETSANERLNSGAITKDEHDAEIEAINSERDNVKSELANFDTEFSDALAETNDAIDAAVPRTTEEYNKLWNDLMTKQQDEQDGVAQMSAHDKEMLKIMPFVRSLVDVRELFAEADKSQSRLKALEEQWKSDAPTPTDTEMEAANRRDRRLQTALKIREERARLYAAKDAARNALRVLNNDVMWLLKMGKTQYMAQQQERLEHRSKVAHIGITAVDTGKERPAGVKGQQQAKESEEKSVGVLRRMWNWVFLAPTESAESMLSRVDVNHFSGEGELYHLIMESERGYSRSEDRRIESIEGLRSEIQSKCKEFFGSKKPKDGNKKIKFTQTLSGEPVPAEVTKGEALSLYLWSLSEDGRTKLESQGIDAFSISEIKAGLGENWVKFGEWVVGDFLPKLYDKYNEKYVEKYGTEITRHENYFPFKIYGGDIVTKDELESFDNGNTIPMPSALKERVKHSYQLSTTEDALKILNEHVAEMEDWYHFADMREDISILLSSRAFRETLKLQGANKWKKFRDAMHALAGVDKRDESVTSQVINEAQSMYASSAVGFRYWTAVKQLQSIIAGVNYSYNPRFQARLFANILMPVGTELLAGKVKNAENTFAGMVGSCYWAWKNLPQFRERYRNGKMGNIMLEYESVVGNNSNLYRWIKKNITQKGLFLNQVFDAAAVAVYSKSIYDYEYTRSIRKGATEEDAHKYAMTCAETNYNKTQQSSGRAYVSKMQVSGNPIEKGLTTFQTASLGFMRKSINHINDIQRAYRLLRLGKEKPLHSISKSAKATVDLLWDGVVMPASWNLLNVIGVAGFYYGAKAIFNALFGGDDDKAPMKDATGKTALDRFIEGHAGDVAFATISAPLQGTILNNLVNSAWSGYGGWTPTMAEGAISEVLRSAGETLKGYKESDSLSDYLEDLDEDAAKYTIKTVLYALFRGYTGIDMKTVERFYNAFYDYKLKGSSLNLISAANFLSTPMSSMRDHEAKDYYLGAYGKTSETAKDLEDYIVKRAYADGKIFKREVESGGARGKVAELFRSRAFKRDLNKYVDEWAEYHIRDASDASDYHDEWLKNHERKEIIRKNRELEYSDEQAKQKTDSLKLALGYEQKSGNSERTLRYNLVHDILRQIKKKLTGGDKERKEAFALMRELERIDKIKGHTHSDYVKLAEKAGVKDFQMIPKGVSESGKYVNKSDIDNGTVARGEVKGSYGIIATADDVKADARFRKLQDGSEKQKAKAKEVMKMYSDGDISYQDAYRRMTDIGDGLVTAVYAGEADRLIKDLKTKLTKAVKAGNDKAADAIMEQIRSIRGKVIDGDMKPKEEVAKMLLNSIR